MNYGPIILIDPAYRDDLGLLAHEREHMAQWIMTLGLHSLLYRFSKQYRFWSEVRAYRVQLTYSPHAAERFAQFIATKYDLDVTVEFALGALNDA